ncbi:hypothetical protein A7D27_14615 [Pseudomonas sp. 1D4]|nr:hypothetical protein A7D27_14615 [Pseudomonas sp. 1D4]
MPSLSKCFVMFAAFFGHYGDGLAQGFVVAAKHQLELMPMEMRRLDVIFFFEFSMGQPVEDFWAVAEQAIQKWLVIGKGISARFCLLLSGHQEFAVNIETLL